MSGFNRDISVVTPADFLNDKNVNAPLKELIDNDLYILKMLNGNRTLIKSIYGNLLDYNINGDKILVNGGKMNTYKNCHTWKALKNFAINNDDDLFFDAVNENMVYKGYSDTPVGSIDYNVNRESWLERDIFIPEILRGQELVFSIKGAKFPNYKNWEISGSQNVALDDMYETVAIEIENARDTVREFKILGPFENFNEFNNESYSPKMVSSYVSFVTKIDSPSIKIKIFRTDNDGYLHINRIFVGSLTLPYDNSQTKYEVKDIDINSFYDFDNDNSKLTATSVMGRTFPPLGENVKVNDLVSIFNIYERVASIFTNATTVLSPIDRLKPEHGSISLSSSQLTYKINHHPIKPGLSYPVISIVSPSSDSAMFIASIFNIQDDNFSISLSDYPENNNYKINWYVPTMDSADIIYESTQYAAPIPPSVVLENYPDIFDFEENY
jgi:hypothetical protein